jgi:hypothetical protein
MHGPPPQPPQQPPPYGHGYPPPYGYGHPPPYAWYPDPHDYYVVGQDERPEYVHRDERDNPPAVTGFSFALCALGLYVLSGGIAFLASIPCSIVGIVAGKRGMNAVDSGLATRHRRYAKAGFVVGIVTLVLSSLTALTVIAAAVFPDAFKDDNSQFNALPAIRVGLLAVRLATGG